MRRTLKLELVSQGAGYYTFAVGESLVINVGDGGEYSFVHKYLELIINALRTGCRMVQVVGVDEEEMNKLGHEFHFLALPEEAFDIRKIARNSGFPNWEIIRIVR
jgi:hypothetical protein